MSVFHLDDIFWNVKAFLTKLGVIVLDHDLESHSKCFCYCGWGPGDGLELQGSPLSSQLLNHSGHLMQVSHKDQCNNLTRSKSLMNTHHPCHMSLYMWRELKRWSSENWESQNWSSWSQSVGEACKIIYWPTLGLKLRTFGRSRFSVEGAFNCASAVPHSRISRQTWSVCTTWGQSSLEHCSLGSESLSRVQLLTEWVFILYLLNGWSFGDFAWSLLDVLIAIIRPRVRGIVSSRMTSSPV